MKSTKGKKKAASKSGSKAKSAKKARPASKPAAKKSKAGKSGSSAASKSASKSTSKASPKSSSIRGKDGRLNKSFAKKMKVVLDAKLEQLKEDMDAEVNYARTRDWRLLQDESDIAADAAEGDLALRIAESDSMTIGEIQDCLQRIVEGSYGQCENCDSPIEEERLEFMPWTPLCVSCARSREMQRKAGERNYMWGTIEEESRDSDDS